jgi:hypothetical protein
VFTKDELTDLKLSENGVGDAVSAISKNDAAATEKVKSLKWRPLKVSLSDCGHDLLMLLQPTSCVCSNEATGPPASLEISSEEGVKTPVTTPHNPSARLEREIASEQCETCAEKGRSVLMLKGVKSGLKVLRPEEEMRSAMAQFDRTTNQPYIKVVPASKLREKSELCELSC